MPGVTNLAFTYWQCHANDRAYAAKIITQAMYEFAREELHKRIDSLSAIRCNATETGDYNGFTEDKASA